MSAPQQSSREPPVILLIGPTGSGKSSFVKYLTTKNVEVNGEKPCTTECKAYPVEVEINGYRKHFTVVDTPGFEDLPEENLATLKNIADTLLHMLPREVYGAIYFHRITDGRMMGTTRSVLSIFKTMCGEKFYPHIAFVTTMWDSIGRQKQDRYKDINRELEKGYMNLCENSPQIFRRLRDDRESSMPVLEHFAKLARDGPPPPRLLLIKELWPLKRVNVRKTSAGREIMKKASSGGPGCCTVL